MRKYIDLTKEYSKEELENFMWELRDSMSKEMDVLLKSLKHKGPGDILKMYVSEYLLMMRFLSEVEKHEFSAEEIAPLLASTHPLRDLSLFFKRENSKFGIEYGERIAAALKDFHKRGEVSYPEKPKKYYMIVTEEDASYASGEHGLNYFANAPWKGSIVGVFDGNYAEAMLCNGATEGLFYQLFVSETGERIGYGIIDRDSIEEDIVRFEKKIEEDI